ncbi:MAG: peptide/nickel transport system substrate-binding protein [Chloroflexota bacterium]|jgi:ABC-type transport system substrate-binding protein|nr:peptide/nickel transport system substrate-binding protein [Chloroflexota bacterium]
MAALAVICSGCLPVDLPTEAPSTPAGTAVPTPAQRSPDELIVAVPEDPQGFLPPAADDTTRLIVDLLYDRLYRLDEHLRPQADLASDLPVVSADGLTWTIGLRDARFGGGAAITASDAAFSLALAASPACPFGRDVCAGAADDLSEASATDKATLSVTLRRPSSPFLAQVLAQLPILSQAAVRSATTELLSGAAGLDPTAPRRQVEQISDATNQDACFTEVPPFGCQLSDYTQPLEKLLADADVSLPPKARFTGPTGEVDAEAYSGSLLDLVSELDQVLTGAGTDQVAAALPMLDPVAHPLGGGPYAIDSYRPGDAVELVANQDPSGGGPSIKRVVLRIVKDPAVAATSLLSGDADWVLRVEPENVAALEAAANVHVAARPLPSERTIVFNVRPGRVYADPVTRAAFAGCLDRRALAADATGGRAIVAETPTSAGAWSMAAPAAAARDVAGSIASLEGAGWKRGTDGIFAKAGKRLTSSIAVRPSRADLLAFAEGAAQQLAECGIELEVRELDLTGDLLLAQLQWPNDFDTVLVARDLGDDPDHDVQRFASAHATSAENPADDNPGGYASKEADQLIGEARAQTDLEKRRSLYGQIGDLLARDVPAWPIWYDTAFSALTDRVSLGDRAVDPAAPNFWWNLESWSLRAP